MHINTGGRKLGVVDFSVLYDKNVLALDVPSGKTAEDAVIKPKAVKSGCTIDVILSDGLRVGGACKEAANVVSPRGQLNGYKFVTIKFKALRAGQATMNGLVTTLGDAVTKQPFAEKTPFVAGTLTQVVSGRRARRLAATSALERSRQTTPTQRSPNVTRTEPLAGDGATDSRKVRRRRAVIEMLRVPGDVDLAEGEYLAQGKERGACASHITCQRCEIIFSGLASGSCGA